MSEINRPANRPVVLIVLDGWGYSTATEHNAILGAHTPVWDRLWTDYPHTLIEGSGQEVGLPRGQMGNSEVGHLNLGAGRVVFQELSRIENSIRDGAFSQNAVLEEAITLSKQNHSAVHIMGLLSPGGVHSHEVQIQAMVDMAVTHGAGEVYLHAFLDGRDTPPRSAAASLQAMENHLAKIGKGRIASVVGRYFAMDRDQRWPRIQAAYELIVAGKGEYQATSAEAALAAAYERGETDEFVKPTAIVAPGQTPVRVHDNDVVIFMNFRADRARQLTQAFIETDFAGFERSVVPELARFVCLTEYKSDFDAAVAFPPERLKNVFGAYIADKGLRQLRIAETEKYAHVTFFFNGGEETPFAGEDRILVNSPQVATYDLKPEMSAFELTDRLVEAILSDRYDVIICNYANPDMVGHSGNYEAVVKAIEAIDQCLGRVVDAITQCHGELLITADHGNAEQMMDAKNDQPHTAHTSNPVPFIYIGRQAVMASHGALSDVSPTMLYLMGIGQPEEMTGHTLVALVDS